jgi:hypothetical protein
MSNKYPTANITLSSIEDKGLTLKIKDSEGKSWTLWKNDYQTQMPSEAYESLMNYRIGETFGVTYGEKQEEYQGKSFTKHTIYSILPPIAGFTAPQAKTSNSGANNASEAKDDKFWDMKAYKQCLWNFWLENRDGQKKLTDLEMQLVWEVFKQIETDAKKRFFDFGVAEDLPVIQQDDPKEIDVSDIPF